MRAIHKKLFECVSVTTLCVLLSVVLVWPVNVNAATETKKVSSGVVPGSMWYMFDTSFERINIWLADGTKEKIPKILQYSNEKLAEVKELAKTDPVHAAEAAARYETYLKEAVSRLQKAEKKGENVDDLVQRVSDTSLEQISSFISIAQKQDQTAEYIQEAFVTIQEQEKEIFELIQDPDKRAEVIENAITFLKEKSEQLPQDVQDSIRASLDSWLNSLSTYLLDKGEEWYASMSEATKQYVREQANSQLDKVKEELIQQIEEFEF